MKLGKRILQERLRRHLSQEELAAAVGVSVKSVSRWEKDLVLPQAHYRLELSRFFGDSPEVFFNVNEGDQRGSTLSEVPPLWHVPYLRNPYFTGREAILQQIHEKFLTSYQMPLAQLQIVSGLGGVGKTQTVLEYTYRFCHNYQAVVWMNVKAFETGGIDYLSLGRLFQLPKKDCSKVDAVLEAMKCWFQGHTDWLLIFDDVEDVDLLQMILPSTRQGHILITTRSQIIGGLGSQLDLQKMEPEEGTLFLLRRTKLLGTNESLEAAPGSVRAQAEMLVELLDGLPLALDQVGAYMEESACTLSDYLERYTARRTVLLSTRGIVCNHHPASVTTTLTSSIQCLELASPVAAELLRTMTFLHKESIPEVFFTQAGETLGPTIQILSTDPLLLDEAIRDLRRFSLIDREPGTKTFSLHRLVQELIRDRMSEQELSHWGERLVRAMLLMLPDYHNIPSCMTGRQSEYQRFLPHILTCAALVKKYDIRSSEAEEFLNRTAKYSLFLGRNTQLVP